MEKLNPSVGGDISELPTNTELCRLLECPICNEIPLPPIYNCSNGHSICSNCRPQLKLCHFCKSEFTSSRNFLVENIVRLCKFHCHYKPYGCEQTFLGESLAHHLNICVYRNGPLNDKEKQSINSNTLRCLYWIESAPTNPIVDDSFCGGVQDGQKVYVIRKLLPNKALVPSHFNFNKDRASFYWDNKIYVSKTFEVLTAHPDTLDWISLQPGDSIPSNAVIGGKSDIGEALYIIRKYLPQGKLCIGYAQGNSRKCIGLDDNTSTVVDCSVPPFEVLVKNNNGILLETNSNY